MTPQGPDHNPAASYDFGTHLWAIAERPEAYVNYPNAEISYHEPETIKFGWARIEESYERYCDENPPADYRDCHPIFG